MAHRDIMPFLSVTGGKSTVRYAPMNASENFDEGEVVGLNNDGELIQMPADTSEVLITDGDTGAEFGIAAFGPAGGAETNDRAAQINPKTGVAYAAGDGIAYYPFNEEVLFITDNLFAAAAASAVVPLQSHIGESMQISYGTFGTPDAGWGVEVTAGVAGTNVVAHILEVLDVNYNPIRESGGTGVHVVFRVTAIPAVS